MRTIARLAFAIGAVAFILIGVLHTYVHLAELSGPDLESRFAELGDIDLQGQVSRSWDLFQGLSLLMGFFSITLGCVLLALLLSGERKALPSLFVCLPVIFLLASISIVGWLYLSQMQVFGGLFGILCFTAPIIAHFVERRRGTLAEQQDA